MKKYLLLSLILFSIIFFANTNKITLKQKVFDHELNTKLNQSLSYYIKEKNIKAQINLDQVNINKVGIYDSYIIYRNKKYPFKIKIIDSTPPSFLTKDLTISQNEKFDPLKAIYNLQESSPYQIKHSEIDYQKKEQIVSITIEDQYKNTTTKNINLIITKNKPIIKADEYYEFSKQELTLSISLLKLKAYDQKGNDISSKIIIEPKKITKTSLVTLKVIDDDNQATTKEIMIYLKKEPSIRVEFIGQDTYTILNNENLPPILIKAKIYHDNILAKEVVINKPSESNFQYKIGHYTNTYTLNYLNKNYKKIVNIYVKSEDTWPYFHLGNNKKINQVIWCNNDEPIIYLANLDNYYLIGEQTNNYYLYPMAYPSIGRLDISFIIYDKKTKIPLKKIYLERINDHESCQIYKTE